MLINIFKMSTEQLEPRLFLFQIQSLVIMESYIDRYSCSFDANLTSMPTPQHWEVHPSCL